MKQHPDRQPGRAKPVNGGNDDDRDADYEFEGKGIDDYDLRGNSFFWGNGAMLDGGEHCVKLKVGRTRELDTGTAAALARKAA